MSACDEIRKLLPILPEDASPEEYRRVTDHFGSCPACRRMQEDLSILERAAAEMDVPDPGAGYWDNFALRVRRGIAGEQVREPARWMPQLLRRPMVGWPAAAAAAVVVFFLVRAMLPGGGPQTPPTTEQQIAKETQIEVGAPASSEKAGGGESARLDAQSGQEAPPETLRRASQEEPVTLAEETPTVPSTAQPARKAPEFKPDAVPAEERQFAATEHGARLSDTEPPLRRTVILRGDTVGAEINKGMPEGRELERAERPNAPFPTGDTSAAQGQRVLGGPMGEGYGGPTPQTPALNRGEFTAQDREFFIEQIKMLSERLAKEKAETQRGTCRALVDMYYQLAMNWRSPADIDHAIEFMAKARGILTEEDYLDLDTKTAALKSLRSQ